jgi:hypothetical protein
METLDLRQILFFPPGALRRVRTGLMLRMSHADPSPSPLLLVRRVNRVSFRGDAAYCSQRTCSRVCSCPVACSCSQTRPQYCSRTCRRACQTGQEQIRSHSCSRRGFLAIRHGSRPRHTGYFAIRNSYSLGEAISRALRQISP